MPWSDDTRGGLHGPTVWRAVIVGLALVLAFVVVGIVVLFRANRSAIDANRDLACRIGAFFVGQPIVRQPEQTEADFRQTVHKAESFLRALKAQDCTHVKGASISTEEINRALHKLHRAVPGGVMPRNPGGGPPGGRPGPPPGGPSPKPKPHCTVEVNPQTGQRVCIDVKVPAVP